MFDYQCLNIQPYGIFFETTHFIECNGGNENKKYYVQPQAIIFLEFDYTVKE